MTLNRGAFLFLLATTTAWSPSSLDNRCARAWVIGPSTQNRNPLIVGDGRLKNPSASAPPASTRSRGNSRLHSSVVSPRMADVGDSIEDDNNKNNDTDGTDVVSDMFSEDDSEDIAEELGKQQEKLSELCNLLQAEPQNLLRFDNEEDTGVRGIFLNSAVRSGDIVLKLPQSSCLTDDRSPSWLHDSVGKDPDRWATRLAAIWIDLYLKNKEPDGSDSGNNDTRNDNTQDASSTRNKGHSVWTSLLPDPEFLRASLPIHWPETTVLNARSTALELAVDSAFFARAEAVDDLVRGIQRSPHAGLFETATTTKESDAISMDANELAHHALDLVQTRSCRLEAENALFEISDDDFDDGIPECRRALAPIFDFVNHGSRNTGKANAYFSLEEERVEGSTNEYNKYLVVRAMRDISRDDEVKMDYGASARPAWKCLLSYGFVPNYERTTPETVDEGGEAENLAEVYMKGVRYEVADDSVPIDMVADATPRQWEEGDPREPKGAGALTPEIALRIAERLADAAYYLLLEPEQILDEHDDEAVPPTPFEVISKQLAASLRWSQHRILLTCAAGLTHFAKESAKAEESSYQ
mmetsp:Transcript_36507/g.76629  ORF Transcript_36507/g.76629 Transcript_36507/m.76629 type:complete len:583 (-) Transcript_36507:1778-3526(-)